MKNEKNIFSRYIKTPKKHFGGKQKRPLPERLPERDLCFKGEMRRFQTLDVKYLLKKLFKATPLMFQALILIRRIMVNK